MSVNIPFHKFNCKNDPLKNLILTFPEIDIFLLSELYVRTNFSTPNGYKSFFNESTQIKSTAILVKNYLENKIIFDQNKNWLNSTRIILKTGRKKKDFVELTSLYRSPSDKTRTKFFDDCGFTSQNSNKIFAEQFLKNLENSLTENSILCGDINWASNQRFSKNRFFEKKYLNFYQNSELRNHASNKITYFPSTKNVLKGTSIDAIFCKKGHKLVSNLEVLETEGLEITDHFPLKFNISVNFKKKDKNFITIRKRITNDSIELNTHIFENSKKIFKEYDLQRYKLDENLENQENICYDISDALDSILETSNPEFKVIEKTGIRKVILSKKYHDLKKLLLTKFKKSKKLKMNLKEDFEYKTLKKECQIEYRKCIRKGWINNISEKAKKDKLNWAFLDEYKNNNAEIPENLTPNIFAKISKTYRMTMSQKLTITQNHLTTTKNTVPSSSRQIKLIQKIYPLKKTYISLPLTITLVSNQNHH